MKKTVILSRTKTIKDFNKTLDASSSVKFDYVVSPTDTTLDQHQTEQNSLLNFESEHESLSLADSSYLEDTIDCK